MDKGGGPTHCESVEWGCTHGCQRACNRGIFGAASSCGKQCMEIETDGGDAVCIVRGCSMGCFIGLVSGFALARAPRGEVGAAADPLLALARTSGGGWG